MRIMHYDDPIDRAEGRRLLKAVRSQAEQFLREWVADDVPDDTLATYSKLNLNKLQAVFIHEVAEGWYDELIFAQNDGCPIIIGTPMPPEPGWSSRQEAQQHAAMLLATALLLAEQDTPHVQ